MTLSRPSFSLMTIMLIGIVLIGTSYITFTSKPAEEIKLTSWDCFGYYLYLPGVFIYDDYEKLDWVKNIDDQYALTGGDFYQARSLPNGNRVGKYFVGIAIMQAPFFGLAQLWAHTSDYPADGFSYPYQICVGIAALFWSILALIILYKVLRKFFNDKISAITLLCIFLATNALQYISIEGGQSHAYILFLYALILYITIRWHENPQWYWAFLGGVTMGLAVACRPTEFIMLFIPLLWSTQNKAASQAKWALVRNNKTHLILAVVGGIIAFAPQIIYWQLVTGSAIYNVGSKWFFLNPFFRVLFGWEKGWFIYTPVTILFVLGLFFIKKYHFRKSILVFCLLNLWIIMAWSDWRYGGSYSTRALVQSYPVFALAFAALLDKVFVERWRWLIGISISYLIITNIFQVWQYNHGIIHFNDMNRKYYQAVYWDASPSPADMSLMDGGDKLPPNVRLTEVYSIKDSSFTGGNAIISISPSSEGSWLKLDITCSIKEHFWDGGIEIAFDNKDAPYRFRFANAISNEKGANQYTICLPISDETSTVAIQVYPKEANIKVTDMTLSWGE